MDSLSKSQAVPDRITFISHATTEALRRASFPSDEPLVEGELDRIHSRAWAAPRAQHTLCGPELRTRQTAHALGLEASIDEDLAEVNYGTWRGLDLEQVEAQDSEGLAQWLTSLGAVPHGGHSLAHLLVRAGRWLESRKHTGHTLAITHPAVIRAALVCALQAPPESLWRIEIPPLSTTDLRFNGRFWTVRSAGCSL